MMVKKRKRMSSQLEEDTIYEIMLLLPLKSLVRFKSLSKQWCNLISSDSVFARAHLSKHQHPSSVIVLMPSKPDPKIAILNVKGGKAQGLTVPFPIISNLLLRLFNCCDGILCTTFQGSGQIHLWNPITKWFKQIDYPTVDADNLLHLSGFGYDSSIKDYKVVRILQTHIEVMNLKTMAWRILTSNGLPEILCSLGRAVYLDGTLYWTIVLIKSTDKIISFDLKTEKWSILQKPRDDLPISVLSSKLTSFRGKLGFFVKKDSLRYEIWSMKEENNWDKLFEVTTYGYYPLCGFNEAVIFHHFHIMKQKSLIAIDGEKIERITTSGIEATGPIGTSYIATLISPH